MTIDKFSAWVAIFSLVLVVTTSEYWLEDQVVFHLISFISPRLLTCTPWVINLRVFALFLDNSRTSFVDD